MKPLRILSLFSGIGFQEMAFPDQIPHEIVNYCEIDDKCSKVFSTLHNVDESKNLKDIKSINFQDLPDDIDIMMSTFPCQSFSIAGKKQGVYCSKNGDLIFYNLQIIRHIKPKVIIFENVKNITSKNFNVVDSIKKELNILGYKCEDKILNATMFGIPQNRERWFMVCNLLEKDFVFPSGFKVFKTLRDFVDTSITERKCDKNMLKYFNEEYCNKSKYNGKDIIKLFDGVEEKEFSSGFTTHRIYSIDGYSPTLTTSNDCHFYELKGKLTSKERFRLMGGNERDYNKIKDIMNDKEIDKVCGNGVVVNVMYAILANVIYQILLF